MRVRARRLTLAPGVLQALHPPTPVEAEEQDDAVERRRAAGRAALSRIVNEVSEAVQRPKPVHGVQDQASPIKSKFWAQSSVSNLTDLDDEDLSTPEFINQATAVGFSLDQLCIAEKALDSSNVNPCSSDVNLAKSIVSKLVQSKCAGAPWKGPLPPPRVSPPRTLGDALAKAAYQRRSPILERSSYSGDVRLSVFTPKSGKNFSNKFEKQYPTSKEKFLDFPPLSPARCTGPTMGCDRRSLGGPKQCPKIFLGPGKVFRPTKGLCALFARTGMRPRITRTTAQLPVKPQKPYLHRSFAKVVRSGRNMAAPGNGGFGNGGFGQGGRGRDAAFDPGFQPGFNPGRGGRGGGHGFHPNRGRIGFNGYNNHGARNSGAHYYGGSRNFGADRGYGRRRGYGGVE